MSVTLALDWTPNTNHSGFYYAKSLGLYEKAGIEVNFLSPHKDQYKTTPASRVADKTATFALCPTESVLSYYTDAERPSLKAVAALMQEDSSAIVTTEASGRSRPKDLDGCKYASYGARYEGRIVQQMIKNDGGNGDFEELTPPMLGIWETVLKGESDATWVFMAWEGVQAEMKGVKLNAFRPTDYGVPYGYFVMVAHPDTLREDADLVRNFLRATAEGFEAASKNPDAAADALYQLVTKEFPDLPEPLDAEMVKKSQAMVVPNYCNSDGKWGQMTLERWTSTVDWLHSQGLLTTLKPSRNPVEGESASLDDLRGGNAGEAISRDDVQVKELFTTEFLP